MFNFSKIFLETMDFSGKKDVDIFEKWIHFLILWIVLKWNFATARGPFAPGPPAGEGRVIAFNWPGVPSLPRKIRATPLHAITRVIVDKYLAKYFINIFRFRNTAENFHIQSVPKRKVHMSYTNSPSLSEILLEKSFSNSTITWHLLLIFILLDRANDSLPKRY